MTGATKLRVLFGDVVQALGRITIMGLVLFAYCPTSNGQTEPEGPTLIFSDDFESGDYFRWSAAEFGAIDSDAPDILLLAPTRLVVYNEDSPLIKLGFFDLESGIASASFRLELDGVDLLPSCTFGSDVASCPSGPLTLGTHEIQASVWDLAGNRGTGTWSLEIAVDTVAPTMSFTLWDAADNAPGTIYNDPTPVVLLDFLDDLAGVDPETVTVMVDTTLAVNCSSTGEQAFCETPDLGEGSHQIQASIRDFGGNPASATFDFELYFDDQAPTLGVAISPAAPRSGEDLQINLTYSDGELGLDLTTLEVEVSGRDIHPQCAVGESQATCSIVAGNPGVDALVVVVKDEAGNEAREVLRYPVSPADTVPPEVTLLEPAEGQIISTPDSELRFSITDDDTGVDLATTQVLLDGLAITATCSETAGVFACPVTGLGRGSHTLEVMTQDLAGNGASTSFYLSAQFSIAVEITQPAAGTLVPEGTTLDVSGTVAAGATAVAVNGVAATVAGGSFSLSGLSLHEGTNVLSAVASDASGNVGYDTVTVQVDGTRPQLSLQYPPEGARLFEPEVTVSGMVHDPGLGTTTGDSVTVTVNGQSAMVEHRSFRAEDVPLVQGPNVLTVEAVDLAGNSRVEVRQILYDPTPANGRLVKVSGDLQTAPILSALTEPLVVQLVDAEGNPRAGEAIAFEVARGNGQFSGGERRLLVVTDAAGQAAVSWSLGSRAGVGAQRVEATVAGVGTISFAAAAQTGPPEQIHAVSGDRQPGVPGQSLGRQLRVIVTDAGQNPVAGAEVIFEVIAGGGTLSGATSQLVLTDSHGYASEEFALGSDLGIGAHQVEAYFTGLSQLPVLFQASAFLEGDPAETKLQGVVLDNAGVPVPGYSLSLLGSSQEVTSGPAGEFALSGVPVGHQFLIADGSTASRPGTWPDLEFEVFLLAGIENRMNRPIFVLPLDIASGVIAGGTEEALVEVPQVPGFSLLVAPGTVTFPNGSTEGVVSATAVQADKIPMAPPEGMQPRFIVSIQPAGAVFDPPAPVTFPNVDGLATGTVTEMFSFDHDLGAFVSIGTGTVSGDGTVIASDPGFGITKAGWHCAAPQSGRGQSSAVSVSYKGPNPVVLLAGGSFPDSERVSAEGTPPRDGEYVWSIEDPNVATISGSALGASCAGEPSCPATITAVAPGQTTGSVRFICTTTEAEDEEDFEVDVVSLQLAELSYSGEAYQEVRDDDGVQYEAPHWEDNSQPPDGDASDPPGAGEIGDRRFPVSFQRGTKMRVTAKFRVVPDNAPLDSLLVRGTGPSGIGFPPTRGTVAGGIVTISDVESVSSLPDMAAFHNPLSIDWEFSVDGGRAWAPAGRSENRVFVTFDSPKIGASSSDNPVEIYESVMEIASRNAAGSASEEAVISSIWSDFQGPMPGVLRKAIDGYNSDDRLEMNYWLDVSDPNAQKALACQDVEAMLTSEPILEFLRGVGTCRAWARLFIATLAAQGIEGAEMMRVFSAEDPANISLLVRDWAFSGPGTAPARCGDGFTHIKGQDLADEMGVPGQGVGNPIAEFNLHFIVRVDGVLYDPSYGSGPFQAAAEGAAWNAWEEASIAGFFRRCRGAGDAGRQQTTGVREVVILPEPN